MSASPNTNITLHSPTHISPSTCTTAYYTFHYVLPYRFIC
jgi:hypothetical protein